MTIPDLRSGRRGLRWAIAAAALCAAAAAVAQGAAAVPATAASASYAIAATAPPQPDAGQDDSRRRDRARAHQRLDLGLERMQPLLVADGPVAERSIGDPPSRVMAVERGAVQARRADYGAQMTVPLGRAWTVDAAFGASRARLAYRQTEVTRTPGEDPTAPLLPIHSDVTLRSRSQGGTLGLTWYGLPNAFVGVAASIQQTNFEAERSANTEVEFYSGQAAGRARGVSFDAGYAIALGRGWSVLPQLGAERRQSRIGALDMGRYTIAEQRHAERQTWAAVQLHRAFVHGGWRLTPYARMRWARREAFEADPVALQAPIVFESESPQPRYLDEDRSTDPSALPGRRLDERALGLAVWAPGGLGLAVDWSRARGSAGLRESRTAAVLRFGF